MRSIFIAIILGLTFAVAQENLNYQQPPKEILELVDVQLPPSVVITENGEYMVMLYRDAYKTIAELSEDELRLGGLRINPVTNSGSRTTYYNNVKVRKMGKKPGDVTDVAGLPQNPRLANFSVAPDESKIALTNTTSEGVELWVLDLASASVKQLTKPNLNANIGSPIDWFKDSRHLLVKMLPDDRKPLIDTENAIPSGPTISTNDGKLAQNRTYQDLLKTPADEHNFEQLAYGTLHRVDLDGNADQWMERAMYRGISFSPDGNYVMITTIEKPFSYLVPYSRFPSSTSIFTKEGALVRKLIDIPLIEDLPQGFMAEREGPRDFSWRNDRPATIVYVEALDGGDPSNEAEFRDEVFEMDAPFNEPRSILKTINRFSGITWGSDELAIAYDYWWDTRNTKTYIFNPENPAQEPRVIFDRNYQDVYSNPGGFVTVENEYGQNTLAIKDGNAFLIGEGYTPEGQFPFLHAYNLKSGEKKELYVSRMEGKKENLYEYDPENNRLLVRIESPSDYPNYYYRAIKNDRLTPLTDFRNPFAALADVHKEVITYKRSDGLELSGTLYLPAGYDFEKKEKLPMILWAYPREYKDRSSASQNTQNPNEFTAPYWGSPLYWVTRGYAVLDDAAFPIVGEGDEEPNDSFRKQLVANARAAIDAVDDMGYIDKNRVAVGGHSYGAFMVANLLSHSDLFAAGIARSGAYNRTLTPFGFQSEQRNYWEAPEVYYSMSPFMHADKMKTPLLLVHGEADNNSGTYPMQSERYFNALKGLGATVRLVMFPKESHGYAAKETILHLLWEQDQWLEKYLKDTDKM